MKKKFLPFAASMILSTSLYGQNINIPNSGWHLLGATEVWTVLH